MPIQFGMWDHFEQQAGIPLAQQYEERIRLIVQAEKYGFYGYHVAEHHLTPLDMAPSPIVFLSALAQRTSRIRLGSMVLCLPLYHPLRLIQEICMIDHISGGRFMPGVGRGIRDCEHEWFGVNPPEARARFDEIVEILVKGLTQPELTHHGKFYSFDRAPLSFAPAQKPYPPLWYAGNLKYPATHGMNALGAAVTREALDEYWQFWAQGRQEHNPLYAAATPMVGSTRHVFIADTDEEALTVARRAWRAYGEHFWATDVRVDGVSVPREGIVFGGGNDIDRPMSIGVLVVGSPATVRNGLKNYLNRIGPKYNYLCGAFQWGDINHKEAMHSLELFAKEVMPALSQTNN